MPLIPFNKALLSEAEGGLRTGFDTSGRGGNYGCSIEVFVMIRIKLPNVDLFCLTASRYD